LVTLRDPHSRPPAKLEKVTFSQDFKQFFLRGLAALLPTLITLWLLAWAWSFLRDTVGRHIVAAIIWLWPNSYLARSLMEGSVAADVFGVMLAMVLIYIIGFFVGNLIGRTFWKLGERLVMRIPVIRAIYPAVKQVTDFVLSERTEQFQASRVVAVEPHEKGIWSIGLVTGNGLPPLSRVTGEEMVTVFVPSSPTAFSGYVLVVPRKSVVELPLQVDEVMQMLVSGGVIVPGKRQAPESSIPAESAQNAALVPAAPGMKS
jgi:uncharacterized membrane protein